MLYQIFSKLNLVAEEKQDIFSCLQIANRPLNQVKRFY